MSIPPAPPASTDDTPEPFRWWQLAGFTLTGLVVLGLLAGAADPAVGGAVYAAGVGVWPTQWRSQRTGRGRPVWWLLVVWPVVPFTIVGMVVWGVLELLSSF